MKNKKKIRLILVIIVVLILLSISISFNSHKTTSTEYNTDSYNTGETVLADNTTDRSQLVYLSDIPYIEDQSYAAKDHYIWLDQNDSTEILRLKVDDKTMSFIKGICAWADSQIVYDLSDYDYDYFTAYLGVDISEMEQTYCNTGLIFYIYTSDNGEDWEEQYKSNVLYGWSNAEHIKIDIKGKKYLKLVADDNSSNWWANWYDEAVYADAKLIKEGYEENIANVDFIKTVPEYDEIIKTTAYEGQEITGNYELTLLQREFVNNVGYDVLQAFVRYSNEYKETIYWLMNDVDTLRLYIVGGRPDGSYVNSLKVLVNLYKEHKDDLNNQKVTDNGVVLGDLYRRMMVSVSLTHSTTVGLWAGEKTDVNSSNAVTRYEIYKKMQAQGLLNNNIFENLTVEEMRWVMNNIIDDEEIEWLNNYSRKTKVERPDKDYMDPYTYVNYTDGYNYSKSEYYDETNYDKWNEKYSLSEYNVSYKSGYPKLWIVFEEGAVCGGISKTGCNLWGAYGVPTSVVHQPGHAAYISYSLNGNGDGVWTLYNDVYGWAQSGYTEVLDIRMPNGWGNKGSSYVTNDESAGIQSASYVLLAQAAQNEYDKYEKSEEILLLENVYKDDKEMLYKIYENALNAEEINFDAWYGLVKLTISDDTKTDKERYELAEKITNTLTYYPLPMYDLIRMIEPTFTNPGYTAKFAMLENKTLETASKATDNESIQAGAVKSVANALLGIVNTDIASFSFDGENAESIVLSDRFEGNGVTWDYSLDGGDNWEQTSKNIVKLSEEEINSITVEDDIKVHILGVDYSEDNIFTIDITKAETPTGIYNNDLENRVIGVKDTMEWKFPTDTEWTSYQTALPDLTGDKTVEVRVANTGTKLYEPITYSFTEDNQPDTRKYVPIAHLSIEDYSTQSIDSSRPYYAPNAIDGNINTLWHTDFRYNVIKDNQPAYITIKLDEPRDISALEFVQTKYKSNDPDYIKSVIVCVSEDKENWTEAGRIENCPQNTELRKIEFDESVYGQYVKLEIETYNMFASLAMVNLFEDVTNKTAPTAEVNYTISTLTNQDVTAVLTSSDNITITNNDGKDTYTFTENGEFTFEFENKYKNKGTATAKVDWIDKVVPTAEIVYSTTDPTDGEVNATLVNFSEENVIITNNHGKSNYTFTENGEFTFEFEDAAGNKNTLVATVTWINQITPDVIATISYDITEETEQDVTATFSIEGDHKYTILNNDGKNTYTFTQNGTFEFVYQDEYGNIESAVAKVDWIKKELPVPEPVNTEVVVTYDIHEPTNQNVKATLIEREVQSTKETSNSGLLVTNNGGSNEYVFTDNGTFTFEYIDSKGNAGSMVAEVNWIDKVAPTAHIEYSTETTTKKPVTAKLVSDGEEIIITNNEGKDIYTFNENGIFVFEFQDLVGNTGKTEAKVSWIEKEISDSDTTKNPNEPKAEPTPTPEPEAEPTPTPEVKAEPTPTPEPEAESTTTPEAKAELTTTSEAKAESAPILTSKPIQESLTAPKVIIRYDINEPTNKNVTAMILSDDNITITNNNGNNQYVFTDNGEFTFKFVNKAGAKGTATAKVNWIDRVAPTAHIEYSTQETTSDPVIARLVSDEDVEVINNNGKKAYTFTENGNFEIVFSDKAGNENRVTATVNWMTPKSIESNDSNIENNNNDNNSKKSERKVDSGEDKSVFSGVLPKTGKGRYLLIVFLILGIIIICVAVVTYRKIKKNKENK